MNTTTVTKRRFAIGQVVAADDGTLYRVDKNGSWVVTHRPPSRKAKRQAERAKRREEIAAQQLDRGIMRPLLETAQKFA